MRKRFPIIMGLSLGVISIIMGQIPNGIRQFTGLTVIGNHIGYLLGALIIVWACSQTWKNGFILCSFMLTIANVTYYSIIFAFSLFRATGESFMSNLLGLIRWLVISIIVSALATTAVWIVRNAKSKLLSYGMFAIAHIGMLGVIYYFNVRFVVIWYKASFEHFQYWQFAGYLFEIVFAILLTTLILAIGLRRYIKGVYN